MKKLVLISAFALIITGCASLNPFNGVTNPPNSPRKVANWTQEESIKPVYVGKDQAGKDIVANEVHRTYTAGAEEVAQKKTLGQVIGGWFGGLSILGLIFVLVSLLAFGGTPILWVFSKYLKMKNALVNTVEGIERMKAEDKAKLTPILLQEQDATDISLIKQLKATVVKPNGPPAA